MNRDWVVNRSFWNLNDPWGQVVILVKGSAHVWSVWSRLGLLGKREEKKKQWFSLMGVDLGQIKELQLLGRDSGGAGGQRDFEACSVQCLKNAIF